MQTDCPFLLPCLLLTSSSQHSLDKQKADRKKVIEEVYLANGLQGSSPSWWCGKDADKGRVELEARAKYSPSVHPRDFFQLGLIWLVYQGLSLTLMNPTKDSSAGRSKLSESNHQAGGRGQGSSAFGSTIPPS